MEDWSKYADIIDLEHPEPKKHPRMSAMSRAAQFGAFAALTGYDAMIEETSRQVNEAGRDVSDSYEDDYLF